MADGKGILIYLVMLFIMTYLVDPPGSLIPCPPTHVTRGKRKDAPVEKVREGIGSCAELWELRGPHASLSSSLPFTLSLMTRRGSMPS